jgi:hypothetical protein
VVDGWVEDFVHLPEQALLICNEGTLVRAKSKRYMQAIDGLVSSGDSRQKYAWEAGQSAHTDDLQINGAARSRFRMLIIRLRLYSLPSSSRIPPAIWTTSKDR